MSEADLKDASEKVCRLHEDTNELLERAESGHNFDQMKLGRERIQILEKG